MENGMTKIFMSDRSMSLVDEIHARMVAAKDPEYKAFQSSLIPTVPKERILGVRAPILRKMAKEYRNRKGIEIFLSDLPHASYDEDNLHAYLIGETKDYDLCLSRLHAFLPYIDNWATCDILRPKIFEKHREELLPYIYRNLLSTEVYSVRFGIGMLLSFYLDEGFSPEHLRRVAAIRREEYYINMMAAWYFATALAKQREETLPYFVKGLLLPEVFRKAVRKCIESNRISEEDKAMLRTLPVPEE